MEKITVQKRSELTVSQKSKRPYFTVGDTQGNKYICFKPGIYDKFTLGSDVEVEITAGRNADDTPRIDIPEDITVKNEGVVVKGKVTYTGRKDDSQKSFALSYAKDIIVAIIGAGGCGFTLEKMTEKQARGVANATKTIANEFNNWLTDTAKVVVGEIEEAKEGG